MRALVTGQTNDSISLSTLVDIECAAASFRTSAAERRLPSSPIEAAFWRNKSTANPNSEILAAARPMLATTNGPLIVVSSPYAKRGEVWNAFRRDYGPNGDPLILVVKGPRGRSTPRFPSMSSPAPMSATPHRPRLNTAAILEWILKPYLAETPWTPPSSLDELEYRRSSRACATTRSSTRRGVLRTA